MNKLRIAVIGPDGRMGQAVLAALQIRTDMQLGGELRRGDAFVPAHDVAVDFTGAAASVERALEAARAGGPALVIGSTGFDAEQETQIARAAERVAIVKSGNFSLGVNLLLGLVARAARALPAADYDIEVFEAHHRRKVDAPSGTALMLGEAAARGRGTPLSEHAVMSREGQTGPRPSGAIGFSVLRAGGIVGEHSVVLAAEDEIVTLSHSARDRGLFARGALAAAAWVAGRPPGLYGMEDVLGLANG